MMLRFWFTSPLRPGQLMTDTTGPLQMHISTFSQAQEIASLFRTVFPAASPVSSTKMHRSPHLPDVSQDTHLRALLSCHFLGHGETQNHQG
jgi:hypothetical protein